MEVVGYGFRIKSHKNPFLVIPFVIQYFFIVCVSTFFHYHSPTQIFSAHLRTIHSLSGSSFRLCSPLPQSAVCNRSESRQPPCISCEKGVCREYVFLHRFFGALVLHRQLIHYHSIVFIAIDSVTTVIQIVGAALIGVAESKNSRGETSSLTSKQANNILLAGLALQVSLFPIESLLDVVS
jgi:hypothetical protein